VCRLEHNSLSWFRRASQHSRCEYQVTRDPCCLAIKWNVPYLLETNQLDASSWAKFLRCAFLAPATIFTYLCENDASLRHNVIASEAKFWDVCQQYLMYSNELSKEDLKNELTGERVQLMRDSERNYVSLAGFTKAIHTCWRSLKVRNKKWLRHIFLVHIVPSSIFN